MLVLVPTVLTVASPLWVKVVAASTLTLQLVVIHGTCSALSCLANYWYHYPILAVVHSPWLMIHHLSAPPPYTAKNEV